MTKPKELPSQEILQEYFNYDSETGRLIWKYRDISKFKNKHAHAVFTSRFVGNVVGGLDSKGYFIVNVDKNIYYQHRVIWKLVTGKEPEFQIDHINGNRSDNRLENLRDVNCSENNDNKRLSKANTSTLKNIRFKKSSKLWYVSKRVQGLNYSIAYTKTAELAVLALEKFNVEDDSTYMSVVQKITNNSKKCTLEDYFNIFEYVDGELIFKIRTTTAEFDELAARRFNNQYAGKKVGYVKNGNYKVVNLFGYTLQAHRIIYQMLNNLPELPKDSIIDHINGDRLDNRIENLRVCSYSENAFNKSKNRNNTSGYKGAVWSKKMNKWQSTLVINKKAIWLGYFNTAEEAHEAYCKAANEYHGEYANHGI
jgi:hypothetical protein